MNKILILFTLLLFGVALSAQRPQITEAQVRQELQRRGLEEDQVRKKLMERGIDVDNVDPSDPAQVLALQTALEQIQKEIEAEKRQQVARDTTSQNVGGQMEKRLEGMSDQSAGSIRQSVEEGTPLEEAIAEEMLDKAIETAPSSIYGQQIFRNQSLKVYRQAEDIRAPDAYVLGAGDVVTVNIWGASQLTSTYTISKSGFIQPSGMPRINLKGLSFGQAKEMLENRFSNYYRFRNEEFEVTLNYSRTISVNILGEAMKYGTFTIPAINTAFNALVAAGGPSDIGSVRNITLRRSGESKRLDVYTFMLDDPSVQFDFYLEDNDIIHIPVAERIVSIQGAVKRPFRYELIQGEELKKLIEYAGGFSANAYQSNIQVQRFVNDEEKIIDVNYRELLSNKGDFDLLPGDQVIVNQIPKPYKNFVDISGAVENESRFELVPNMTVADLVRKGVLDTDARTDIAFLLRVNPDETISYKRISISEALRDGNSESNITLQPRDILRVLSQTAYVGRDSIQVQGAVRRPSILPFDSSRELKVEDAVILSGGLLPEATDFAYILRTDPNTRNGEEYLRVNLKNALENPNSTDNLILRPQDRLVVYNYKTFEEDAFVKVDGAVRNAGEYPYDPTLSLRDALTLSGGLKLEAAQSRIDIFRLQISGDQETRTVVATLAVDDDLNIVNQDDFQLAPYDQIYVRSAPEFEFQQNVIVQGEVRYPGTYALTSENEKILSVVKRAGGLTEEAFPSGATLYRPQDGTGYIVMDLEEVIKTAGSNFNYILKEGDVIQIPKQKDFVTITGATQANELYADAIVRSGKINVPYHAGKSAKFYIEEYAAGLSEDGRGRLVTVEHPNGELEKTKGILFFKDYPDVRKGSTITVGRIPEEIKEEKKERKDIDWGKVLSDSIIQATSILSLILLIQNVN